MHVYTSTFGPVYYTVPAHRTFIMVDLYGGDGGDINHSVGGKGARVRAIIAVIPGEILQVRPGGGAVGSTPGFNGGGGTTLVAPGGGGGGASDIRRAPYGLADRLLVAAGGGGCGNVAIGGFADPAHGGDGGYPDGADGTYAGVQGGGYKAAFGATQTAGGLGGTADFGGPPGGTGTPGIGGDGVTGGGALQQGGGGGGGGLWGGGGGGGGNQGGGAGGGSCGVLVPTTDLLIESGVWNGEGLVIIYDDCDLEEMWHLGEVAFGSTGGAAGPPTGPGLDAVGVALIAETFVGGGPWVTSPLVPHTTELLAVVLQYGGTGPPALGGNGATWTLIESVGYGATGVQMWLFEGIGDLSAGQLTVTLPTAPARGMVHVAEFTNPAHTSYRVAQHTEERADESATKPQATTLDTSLSRQVLTDGLVFAAFNNTKTPATLITPDVRYTPLGSTSDGDSSAGHALLTEWAGAGPQDASASTSTITQWMSIVVELYRQC